MKRASICMITAVALLALVAVPALACNGTVGKAFKVKSDVDYWEHCYYIDPGQCCTRGTCLSLQQHRQITGMSSSITIGEQEFTATDRIDRNKGHKVTWNRHVDGTATIYSAYTGGTFAARWP